MHLKLLRSKRWPWLGRPKVHQKHPHPGGVGWDKMEKIIGVSTLVYLYTFFLVVKNSKNNYIVCVVESE